MKHEQANEIVQEIFETLCPQIRSYCANNDMTLPEFPKNFENAIFDWFNDCEQANVIDKVRVITSEFINPKEWTEKGCYNIVMVFWLDSYSNVAMIPMVLEPASASQSSEVIESNENELPPTEQTEPTDAAVSLESVNEPTE